MTRKPDVSQLVPLIRFTKPASCRNDNVQYFAAVFGGTCSALLFSLALALVTAALRRGRLLASDLLCGSKSPIVSSTLDLAPRRYACNIYMAL